MKKKYTVFRLFILFIFSESAIITTFAESRCKKMNKMCSFFRKGGTPYK